MDAAQEWLKGADLQIRHIETAHRFAGAITSARPSVCLSELLNHHEVYGGRLRWFVLRNGRIERARRRALAPRATASVCGRCADLPPNVASSRTMPPALRDDDEAEEDEPTEGAGE